MDEYEETGPSSSDEARPEEAEETVARDRAGQAPPPSPMPLSMPPFSAAVPPASEPTRPMAPVPPPSPMPLSMPPYLEPVGGGTPPPYFPPRPRFGYGAPPEPVAPPPRRSRKTLYGFLIAVVIAAGVGAGFGVSMQSNSPSALAPSGGKVATLPVTPKSAPLVHPGSLKAIENLVIPSVVDIDTTMATAGGVEQGAGTGMIVTASGEVLTNNHVVEGATSISITLPNRAGSYGASVLGVDPTYDVALLQLKSLSGLPTVSLGDSSKLKTGTSVIAFGNALGAGGKPTVTTGTVTGLDRSIQASDAGGLSPGEPENLSGLIETSASIQPGDSGGALVNGSGQVIGMITAAADADFGPSVGFAIPINQARKIARLIEQRSTKDDVILGLSAFLGVSVDPADASGFGSLNLGNGNPAASGQLVESVVPNGPAADAGIVGGDTITSIDNVKVTNNESSLTNALGKLRPGDKVNVGFIDQSGATHTATVVLGSIPK